MEGAASMPAELEGLHEECGVFGVWGHPDAARLTYFGLHALQHRGQEGAGIVSNNDGHLIGHRGLGLLTQVFSEEANITRLKGNTTIGHVRYATSGSGSIDNIQPFIFRFHDGDVALCHNGNLTNCESLKCELEEQGAIFHSNSDTEVLMHLIRRAPGRHLHRAIEARAESGSRRIRLPADDRA
jgi:amidophosphoribosyltransferase